MFETYKKYLLSRAVYEKDENGIIVVSIPGYESFFTQGENVEEARQHLLEVIEEVVLMKLELQDKNFISDLKKFTQQKYEYA